MIDWTFARSLFGCAIVLPLKRNPWITQNMRNFDHRSFSYSLDFGLLGAMRKKTNFEWCCFKLQVGMVKFFLIKTNYSSSVWVLNRFSIWKHFNFTHMSSLLALKSHGFRLRNALISLGKHFTFRLRFSSHIAHHVKLIGAECLWSFFNHVMW